VALIHLDAGVLIGFLDDADAHHDRARAAIADAVEQGDRLEVAASAFAETLVAPASRGEAAVAVVHGLRLRLPVHVVPLDVEIAAAAARLRARHRALRLPDALVVATASVAGADRLVTTDRRWPAARSLGFRGRLEVL
jgi:predicted nucleic acid-binding protein